MTLEPTVSAVCDPSPPPAAPPACCWRAAVAVAVELVHNLAAARRHHRRRPTAPGCASGVGRSGGAGGDPGRGRPVLPRRPGRRRGTGAAGRVGAGDGDGDGSGTGAVRRRVCRHPVGDAPGGVCRGRRGDGPGQDRRVERRRLCPGSHGRRRGPVTGGPLRAFGTHLGAAFRLVDDLLGIWGRPLRAPASRAGPTWRRTRSPCKWPPRSPPAARRGGNWRSCTPARGRCPPLVRHGPHSWCAGHAVRCHAPSGSDAAERMNGQPPSPRISSRSEHHAPPMPPDIYLVQSLISSVSPRRPQGPDSSSSGHEPAV